MNSPETESRPFGGWRELLHIAWPLIINSGTFAVLNFCDRLFLAQYGEAEFRASLPSGILFFTLVCGFMALAGFTNTFVAQMWGAGDKPGCAKATAQGILFAILSIPLIMLLVPAGLWFLKLSGHGPEIYALEQEYPELANTLLVCATETRTDADIEMYADHLSRIIKTQTAADCPVKPKMA